MKSMLRRSFLLFLATIQILVPLGVSAAPQLQGNTPEARALELLEGLSPEERVGQLFLVNFDGTDLSEESQIYDLIVNHHVGGVMLKAENDNFVVAPGTVNAAWEMNGELQRVEWNISQGERVDEESGELLPNTFVPLFIGISQEGDGYPHDQILNGLTPLPNQMALGATWEPDLAEQVGQVMGQELSSLGFNLLIGPSLDVLEAPNPESPGDLGTRTFGGDPFWVGRMGRSFVTGLHLGSQDQLVVVGKHFPGHGNSDRPPEEEVPTIRKSLVQLTQIELAPFFAVTGNAPNEQAAVDALLLSHIRYQGFQGNIRETTRPVSFDPQAFGELMALEPFQVWREGGGVIISDELGSRAVRRFFDPSGISFNAEDIARNAFLAGNDILNLGDFSRSEEVDNYASIVQTLEFFTQKYNEDLAFAQRVDESVLRILTLKFELYSSFTLGTVVTGQGDLANINAGNSISFDVARSAVSLISPDAISLDTALPNPPTSLEQIVFVSDTYTVQQCTECPEEFVLEPDALQQAVLRLYGPGAGNLTSRVNLTSYTYQDIVDLLDIGAYINPLTNEFRRSEWVVFAQLDANPNRPASLGLRRLLDERPDLLQGKNVIVFAFNAPYYFDATDASKLTAYYSLYSKGPEFVDVAARLLYRELGAPGASPVSISELGYELIEATSPNPEQIIGLEIQLVEAEPNEQLPEEPTATPLPDGEEEITLPEVQLGDLISLRTTEILDSNGNRVPDNTPVRFIFTTGLESNLTSREIISTTTNGTAQTTFLIENSGLLAVRAVSGDPPASSEEVQLEIAGDGSQLVETPETLVEEPTATPVPESAGQDEDPPPEPPRENSNFGDWLLVLAISIFIALFAYQTGALRGQVMWGVRWALSALIGGLIASTYLGFNLPGTAGLVSGAGLWGIAVVGGLGALAGWGLAWLWQWLDSQE
ncbi:MAG: hypothetical protein DWQ07_25085 [Chloroflexi bacterium]|nr:MAG: hypothetical protein DWQ07_25085 [Chloroflexota bacterium]MBL1196190.1 hypothetical protein [Chloroflexota bacterium]NOH13483.1 hypothetical protein [Chloroflexota bacterium]